MSNVRYTKIGINPKKELVRLSWEVDTDAEEPDKHSLEVHATPHAEFAEALAALAWDVVNLCELPVIMEEDVEVRGVTLTWKKGVMGAVITGLRALKSSPAPLVLNTPHMTVEPYGDSEEGATLLPGSTVTALDRLVREAERFRNGRRAPRAQTGLFDVEEDKAEEHAGELAGV